MQQKINKKVNEQQTGVSKTRIKDAETSVGANAIYRAVKARKYGLTINDLPHGRGYFKK